MRSSSSARCDRRAGLVFATRTLANVGCQNTLLVIGYPKHAKEHSAGQVNIERALTAYRIESESSRLAMNTED